MTQSLKIIWCARSILLSIFPGCAANLRLIIRPWVGYVFAIRSERLICREVQVNLAYRWFCKLGIEDAIPDHSAFSRARNERFRDGDVFRNMFERVVEACITAGLVAAKALRSMRA